MPTKVAPNGELWKNRRVDACYAAYFIYPSPLPALAKKESVGKLSLNSQMFAGVWTRSKNGSRKWASLRDCLKHSCECGKTDMEKKSKEYTHDEINFPAFSTLTMTTTTKSLHTILLSSRIISENPCFTYSSFIKEIGYKMAKFQRSYNAFRIERVKTERDRDRTKITESDLKRKTELKINV